MKFIFKLLFSLSLKRIFKIRNMIVGVSIFCSITIMTFWAFIMVVNRQQVESMEHWKLLLMHFTSIGIMFVGWLIGILCPLTKIYAKKYQTRGSARSLHAVYNKKQKFLISGIECIVYLTLSFFIFICTWGYVLY